MMLSRTPDEIKQGLMCLMSEEELDGTCGGCAYLDTRGPCADHVLPDVLALVEQLQADNAGQVKTIMWMKAERDDLKRCIQQLEAENASLRSERDIAVKALISVSDKVEMVQGILDDDIFHRVEYDVYLQLRDLVDNEIMSWQHEPENSDGTQEDNNAESS